jgi:hypothetical protein
MRGIAALLFGASCLIGPADALAQARIEPFGAAGSASDAPRLEACTADRRWCAQLLRRGEGDAWRLKVGGRELTLAPPGAEVGGSLNVSLWPQIVTSAGGSALIGVEHLRRAAYSGGGASVTILTLVEAPADGGALRPIAELPLQGGAIIRACFSDQDRRRRRGACQDEYGFEGTLQLGSNRPGALPDLLLTTTAETSPGRRSRFEENVRPVPRGGSPAWRDPVCSYRRTFTYDVSSARYRPDRPLPACRDYLEP